MTNAKLNELLGIAKQAQSQWETWENEGAYDLLPSWKPLYRQAQDAWTALHRAIRESEPCIVSLENGETRKIGTVGMLCSSLMMYYSEDVRAKHTMAGTNLKFVASIEKVESTAKDLSTEEGLNND